MINQNIEERLLELAPIQRKAEMELLQKQNVVGVGLGNKWISGVDTGQESLVVLVRNKFERSILAEEDVIPEVIDGRKTDVVAIGDVFAQQIMMPVAGVATGAQNGTSRAVAPEPVLRREPALRREEEVAPLVLRQRIRPVMGGFSVGHHAITAGTIATGCYDATPFPGIPPKYYILSNNHVLANANVARAGEPILQPGPYDGGTVATDTIGVLSRFVPIQFIAGASAPLNFVDAAIAEVPFHLVNREIYWIGHVQGIRVTVKVGEVLQKTGRTTNYTTGRVVAVNATIDVNYGSGQVARFARQIVTTNMSAGGDSGSLVLDLNEKAVGLLFAGSTVATIINPIQYVQKLLNIRITEKA